MFSVALRFEEWLPRPFSAAYLVAFLCILCGPATALQDQGHIQKQRQDESYTRAERHYRIPNVTLRDRHDRAVELQSLLDDERPIVLQFIFTSCETICPMLTAMASQAQAGLRELDGATRMVSISIDPDYDTPQRLDRYATQFGVAGDWRFLTGSWSDIRKTLNAFDAMYAARNKMFHKPYTFMRAAHDDTWVRLIGLMGAARMVTEYRRVLKDSTAAPAVVIAPGGDQ